MLITGGCGYVGSFLARDILRSPFYAGETVRILDNLSANSWVSIASFPEGSRIELVIGDILDDEELDRALADVDTVFHLAGPVGSAAAADGGRPSQDVIFGGTKKVLEASISRKVESFVNTSTGGVYGRIKVPVADEQTECSPEGPYAVGKLDAERYSSRRAVETGLRITSLRLATVSGFNVVMRMENILHRFVIFACIGKPLPVWTEARGMLRPFVDIRDVAQAFAFAGRDSRCPGGVFNVCNFNESSDGLAAFITSLIPKARVVEVDQPVLGQNNFTYPQDGSAISKLGFKYRCGLLDTVESLIGRYVGVRTRVRTDLV